MTVGYLFDAFDLFNVRDLDVIAQARDLCSRLVVGVLSDEDAEALSGRAPVVPLSERLALLQHVRGVDEVVVHDPALAFPAADTVFVAEEALAGGVATVLGSRRESASSLLRHSLRPVGGSRLDAGRVA